MKRITAFFLILCSLFLLLSCSAKQGPSGQEPEPPVQSEPEVPIPEITDEEHGVDFFGKTFTIATVYPVRYRPTSNEDDYGPFFECRLAAIGKAEKDLNCKIAIETITGSLDALSVFVRPGGEDVTDIIDYNPPGAYPYYKAGMLADYDSMESIDLTDEHKWGSYNVRVPVTWGGKTYAVWPSEYPNTPEYNGSVMYNLKLIRDFGVADPVELYEKKQWDYSHFKDMIGSCNENTGDLSSRIYGITLYGDEYQNMAKMAIFANGGRLITRNSAGTYELSLSGPEVQEALTFCNEIYGMKDCIKKGYSVAAFAGGNVTFEIGHSWVGIVEWDEYPLQTLTDGFGWIHFPAGPHGENGKTFSSYLGETGYYLFVPSVSEVQEVGYLIDYWMEENPEYTREDHLDFLCHNMFYTETGFRFYMEAVDNVNYNYYHVFDSKGTEALNKALASVVKGTKGFSEAIQAFAETVQPSIDRELNGVGS